MTRGLFIFLIQLVASIGISAIGIWAVALPKHLQRFISQNFALLPAVRSGSTIATMSIRIAGIALIFYGFALGSGFKYELAGLGM